VRATIYDPPSGWMHGFPRQFLPESGESLEDTLIRDGYPRKDAGWASEHTRFWETEINDEPTSSSTTSPT